MTRSSAIAAGVLLLVMLPAIARADDAPASGDPLVPFEEGRALVRAGRFAEALVAFEKSFAIKPTSGALLNIADCHEKLGRYASASDAFARAAALASENDQAERVEEAKSRREALAPLVSHLTVERAGANDAFRANDANDASDAMNAMNATLTVDGEPAAFGETRAVDGGEHVVRVEAPCRAPNEAHVTVGLRSDAKVVRMALGAPSTEPQCGGPAPVMTVVSPPEAMPASWGTQKTVAVVMGGASLVALGAGIAFGVAAASKQDTLEGACRDYPSGCPLDRRDELEAIHDDASRDAAFSTVGIAAGVVFLGAAVGLYLTAPKQRSRAAMSTPLRVAF